MRALISLVALLWVGCVFGNNRESEPVCNGELCNGKDDDCDGMVDEDFPSIGDSCDGEDEDQCDDGKLACAPGGVGLVCDDAGDTRELCNGEDDDCDSKIDEEFPTLGTACDGDDNDLCSDGMFTCAANGQGVTCEDPGDMLELCNGVDDDCNPATVDGADETAVGTACDGVDGDVCSEGSIVCMGAQMVCNDASSLTIEACNGLDDDCDTRVDETYTFASDVANCGSCGHVCRNPHGPTQCAGSQCVPACGPGAQDCNGLPDDGCEVLRDANPTCTQITNMGAISGDSGTQMVQFTGTDEGLYEVTLTEVSTSTVQVTATFNLDTPAGVNFDLYVYCAGCGGAIMASSTNAAGVREVVLFRHKDVSNVSDTQAVFVEVRFAGATTCGAYTLTVLGNSSVGANTCGPP